MTIEVFNLRELAKMIFLSPTAIFSEEEPPPVEDYSLFDSEDERLVDSESELLNDSEAP